MNTTRYDTGGSGCYGDVEAWMSAHAPDNGGDIRRLKRNLHMAGVAGYFSQIAAGEMVTRCKPAPELFLLAAKLLDLPPQNCLVLEDSFNGVRAGRAAGCVTVMVPDGSWVIRIVG